MIPPSPLDTPDHPPVRIAAEDVSVTWDDAGGGRETVVPLRDRDLLVLVGFTGAGKSTTLAALEQRRVLSAILPDRRVLTDKVILPAMTGDPGRKVTDRLERFSLTAAFRDQHPGGMGDVLARLTVPRSVPEGLIVFDGLRGDAEITAACKMPRAKFLYLETSPDIRLTRLCLRDDPFDRTSVVAGSNDEPRIENAIQHMLEVLAQFGIDQMMDAPASRRLAAFLANKNVAPDMVAQAAAILSDEATHYSAPETLDALHRLAPDRTLVLDSGTLSPDQLVDAVVASL